MGRKVRMADGAALKALALEIKKTISAAGAHDQLGRHCQDLGAAMSQVQQTLESVSQAADPSLALANATIFLDAMGHVVIAWMWLKQAIAALEGQAKGKANDAAFYSGKIAACKFFYRYELPKAMASFELVSSLDDTCFNLTAEEFIGQ
jgi:butyryl-CoA dehydrogenase